MKVTRYQLEKTVQEATTESAEWLKEQFKAVLESDKEFTAKCDYMGYSILSIDDKVKVLEEQIKELQSLKKQLKEAKQVALTVGAELFASYGISKIEGAGISSITVNKSSNKTEKLLHVKDEELLIQAGFYKKVLDKDALMKAMKDSQKYASWRDYFEVETIISFTPAKLKINKRRKAAANAVATEILDEGEAA